MDAFEGDRVRVVRGRAPTREADRTVTAAMLAETGRDGVPAFRAWTPHRQVAFGRRDSHADGYEAARRAADERGFPPVERSVGGRAVAYTGATTLAFAHVVPTEDIRTGLDDRYDAATESVVDALASLGVAATPGEPPNSFCPGAHSVQADGKLCGIAQRVRSDAALVSGVVVAGEREELAAVLAPVYEALDVPFDPETVGSVAESGGPSDPEETRRALEASFVGDAEWDVTDAAAFVSDEE
ncbi:lipoate--protein ligase family protein [Halopelagius longus]|uniref:Lipoate--protein ligase family protein n=1 Tax=Halopelagius longus TaxID=1236180 RepID=A0A1H0XPX3_9EURY|nr:lipoate--protein ligase family protein [Halopelagius longus]RDI72010.1 lipoate--protein ligase family protein [Halopelagius longus]SDQ04987.1 Lipoate-protein ligase A [Halopelagius longus]